MIIIRGLNFLLYVSVLGKDLVIQDSTTRDGPGDRIVSSLFYSFA
jgi:hypothetical protein